MSWRILLLLIAHVLAACPVAASTQDSSNAAPTPVQQLSLSSSSLAVASTGKSNDSPGKSVVVNWKLTCQQLCGEGYGGPACGLACLLQQNATKDYRKIHLDSKAHTAVCPVLCKNGLGAGECHCKPSSPPNFVHDHNHVCRVFCTAAKIQLDGCGLCSSGQFSDMGLSDTDVQTTTPNWDELCTLWCRMGEGGTLCNCDLPPFV